MTTTARDRAERGIRSRSGKVMGSTNWFTAVDSGFAAGLLRGRTNWDVRMRVASTEPPAVDA